MPDQVLNYAQVIEPVVPESNFTPQGVGTTDCNKICNYMVNGQLSGNFIAEQERLLEVDLNCLTKNPAGIFTGSPSANLNHAISLIDVALDSNKPVLAAVHRGDTCSIHNDGTTSHFILLVGKGSYGGKTYYRYFDPGSATKGKEAGNLLSLNNNKLTGKNYSNKEYTVVYISRAK